MALHRWLLAGFLVACGATEPRPESDAIGDEPSAGGRGGSPTSQGSGGQDETNPGSGGSSAGSGRSGGAGGMRPAANGGRESTPADAGGPTGGQHPDASVPDATPVAQKVRGARHTWAVLPPGQFLMGTPAGKLTCGIETQHQVTLTRPFAIDTNEVTEAAFARLMGYRPTRVCDDCPVANVTWSEAVAYCDVLSRDEAGAARESCFVCSGSGARVVCRERDAYAGARIYECPGFRVPTEAEFEYALRGGTTTDTYAGDLPDPITCEHDHRPSPANRAILDRMAVYGLRDSADDRSAPVGRKAPNAWGLHDMAGNVWNWLYDRRQIDLGVAAVVDPVGSLAADAKARVVRGGSYHYGPLYLRSGDRGSPGTSSKVDSNTYRSPATGFRCARTLPMGAASW